MWKSIAFIVSILLSCSSGYCQNKKDNSLAVQWKFSIGDSIHWANPKFDDSKWITTQLGKFWETDIPEIDYDGFGWFRKQVLIPTNFESTLNPSGKMILNLGCIDDADEVYINGIKIGQTGKLPPNYEAAYTKVRKYIIDNKFVNFGKSNTIAIRVFDGGGGGGIYKGDFYFEPLSWKENFNIKSDFLNNHACFEENKKVILPVLITTQNNSNLRLTLTTTVVNQNGLTILEQTNNLVSKSNNTLKLPIKLNTSLNKGFYKIFLVAKDVNNFTYAYNFSIAVSPDKLEYPTNQPIDLTAFWKQAKIELSKINPDYKMTLDSSQSTKDLEVYLVEMKSLNNVLIRGWYSKPIKEGKFPGILRVQGYSSFMQPAFGINDFAILSLNIRGHGNSKDDINPGFPGYLISGLENKNSYIYKGAFMDCIRALDFLCAQPNVDTSRIGVEGLSQGGALTLATAALDKRIKAAAPDIPFLSDFRNYFSLASWPATEYKKYQQDKKIPWDSIYATLAYFDIKNLAPWIKCDVLMSVGLEDNICPPPINFAAFNNLGSKNKTFFVYTETGHSVSEQHYTYKYDWFRKKFNMN